MARRKRDERGAVAAIMAVIAMVLVLIAAFAVDLGVQRVARRDMQSLADVVALDLVRELDGRKVGVLDPLMPGLAQASLTRNKLCGPSGSPKPCAVGELPELAVELGKLNTTSGEFSRITDPDLVPTAVKVTSSTSVGFAFVPGNGTASRTSIADLDAGACIKVGAVGAGLNTQRSTLLNAVIGDALGSNVNLSLVSYQGLANANVSLAELVAVNALHVGTVDELLTTQVGLADFYNATATVLDSQGNTAQADIFRALALQVGPLPKVELGDVITAEQGNGAAERASFNVLDLLYGSAIVADGKSFVDVPAFGVDLGITTLNGMVRVIQPAKPGCGRKTVAEAKSEQVETNLDGSIVSLPGVSAVGLTINSTAVTIEDLIVKAASARGVLNSAECGVPSAASPDRLGVLVAPGLVSIDGKLNITLGAELKLPLGLLGALVLVKLEIKIPAVLHAAPSAAGSQVNMEFTSLADYQLGHPAGSAGIGLTTGAIALDTANTTVTATLLNLPIPLGSSLATVVNLVSGITGSLTTSLNDALVLPLLNMLGVRLASADVFGVPRPLCGEPALRG